MSEMSTGVSNAQERKRQETLLEGQRRILELINKNSPLRSTLDEICRVVEGQADGMLASILLLDEEGKHLLHGAGPSLPEGWNKAVHGISIGPDVGSCGTAAFTGEPYIAEDIRTDPKWAPFKTLAHDTFGLAACWSTPIRAYDGRVIATFAIYHKEPKKPTLKERKLIDFSQHLVAIAVNRHRELEQLEASLQA